MTNTHFASIFQYVWGHPNIAIFDIPPLPCSSIEVCDATRVSSGLIFQPKIKDSGEVFTWIVQVCSTANMRPPPRGSMAKTA